MKGLCQVALKEWSVVVRALGEGRQLLLFRKGGIREEGREFKVEENEFFFFPTFEHQQTEGLQEEFRSWLSGLPQKTPETLQIDLYATVERVFHISSPELAYSLRPYHIYSDKQLLERFQYKPTKPLYVLLLKVFRIPAISLPNLPAYAGCTSWVRLESVLSTAQAVPILPEEVFRKKVAEIEQVTAAETPTARRRGG